MEEISKESELKFSEDEETLIIRMYNLVGEREDPWKNSRGNREVLELQILNQSVKRDVHTSTVACLIGQIL
ncbi:unnamed protein product [Thlaspi arvense]|uniref:Uncharacterized protein n=1 Tax=Thlaspi arvense TaxID=13288 RepID=A0AAU9S087_THLAR|nr:unnamed protein product [Thlaspi arvense]